MTTTPVAADLAAEVDRVVGEHVGELVALRRQLHAHPEVSSAEVQTTRTVAERLRIAGLTPTVLARGTGLVCDVVGESPLPLVALRADIDALAMDDHTTTDYRSQVPGVAHACGHDAHTAIVLGAGIVLARAAAHLGHPRLGAPRVRARRGDRARRRGRRHRRGLVPDVSSVYGLHCDPKLDSGYVGLRAGAITSATDKVTLELHGPGGHTARPHLTVDLVAEAARVALELPVVLARIAGAHGRVTLVWGSLRTGDAPNVIPSRALLTGTLRTPDHAVWDAAPRLIERAVAEVMSGSAATWDLRHDRGVPAVVNDEKHTELMADVVRSVLGEHAAVDTDQSLGGDSFAWFLQEVPGSYARLGVRDPEASGPGSTCTRRPSTSTSAPSPTACACSVLSALAALVDAQ